MADNGADFDLEGYLATRFGDVNKPARVLFPLEMLHKEFSSLPDSLNILDYGTGPVIMTVISAAAKASELVLSDFNPRNLSALRAWLADEPGAFNWTPFFQHVVCDLEGKSVQEAAAREALVRNKVKSVVSANIYSSHIIEEGFEGPYDVVSSSCCLESICKTRETFKRNLQKLSALLKPGGRIILFLTERRMETESGFYYIGSQKHNIVSVNATYVADLLASMGYTEVKSSSCSGDPDLMYTFQDKNILGYMFVSGVKR